MTASSDFIEVRGAREHNLRDASVRLPKNALICFTGVSGSGKSSLAFDTLYAEGQRRYIESLSSYARQFLGQLAKPDVDYVSGLAPSISIAQKSGGANPRSTVGTITEVHDYLRVLFARVGRGHCPKCDAPIEAQTREQIVSAILGLPEGRRAVVLAPVVRNQKGEFRDLFRDFIRRGYLRARVDGEWIRLADRLGLDRRMRHDVEIVVDRVKIEPTARLRLAEAVHQAVALSDGSVVAASEEGAFPDLLLSSKYACPACRLGFEPPTPQLFSFNSPIGMCPRCDGLGEHYTFDPDLLAPDPSRSIREGAIATLGPMRAMGRWRRHILEGVAAAFGCSLDAPWRDLPKEARDAFLYGAGDRHITFTWRNRGRVHLHGGEWEGIIPQLAARYKRSNNGMQRRMLERYMRVVRCPECRGERLNAQARRVRVAGRTLVELEAAPVDELARFLRDVALPSFAGVERRIAVEPIKEILARLGFLQNVGLHYLTLDRRASTLSGGESQRIRLAGQIGSGLVGVLYVLDEPSIGLHPRDNAQLLEALGRLRDQGNTVIVVEHDEETMRAADHLVDFGPGPGTRGGRIVAEGAFADVVQARQSVTGQYLSGARQIAVPAKRRPVHRNTPPPSPPPRRSRQRRV